MKWVGALIVSCFCLILVAPSVHASTPEVKICAVKTGGADIPKEYIDICNNSDTSVDVSGWSVEYAKPNLEIALPDDFCVQPETWKSVSGISTDAKEFVLSADQQLQPFARLRIEMKMNDGVGGSVRLMSYEEEGTVTVMDLVGWGDADSEPPCTEGNMAQNPKYDDVLMRLTDSIGELQDTGENECDFILIPHQTASSCAAFEPGDDDPLPPQTYLAIQINELLANPASPLKDSEAEFIELYNPHNTAVSLKGYTLQTGDSFSYSYTFPNVLIEPGEYLAIYSSETKLVLSNTSGRARLLDPAGVKVDETEAYQDVKDNQAWAVLQDIWQMTDKPTPNAPNELFSVLSENQAGTSAEPRQNVLEACPEGKFRNPETNRCKSIVSTVQGLTPCKVGQERNPETNRCRSVTGVLSSSLVPCQAGYERNPETNRCRKTKNDEPALKPCQAGYERNPSTNRCRKIVATPAANFAAVTTDAQNAAQVVPMNLQWWATGFIASGVVGYGMYEWRHEIFSFIQKVRTSFSRNGPPQ